jgi:hypothetical protein
MLLDANKYDFVKVQLRRYNKHNSQSLCTIELIFSQEREEDVAKATYRIDIQEFLKLSNLIDKRLGEDVSEKIRSYDRLEYYNTKETLEYLFNHQLISQEDMNIITSKIVIEEL